MAMAEMQVEGLDANRYDSSLSYEERSRIGMEEREKLQENAKSFASGSSSKYLHDSTNHQTSSSHPLSSAAEARTLQLQNGGSHHGRTMASEKKPTEERNGKVSPVPLPAISEVGKAKLPASSSHTERNGFAHGAEPNTEYMSPITPEMYDFSQRRNTPILSRAQIEDICNMSPAVSDKYNKKFSAQRRNTPILSPGQIRLITEMSNDSMVDIFEGREHLFLDPSATETTLLTGENQNGNHNDRSEASSELQSFLNGLNTDPQRDGRDNTRSSLSRQSTHSSSSVFTVDGLDQLLSPTQPKSTDAPTTQFFSSGLQFVDSVESPTSPKLLEPEPTIRGPAQKTTVVYRDHEDSSGSLVTMIPSSGFFDPSQSQVELPEESGSVFVPLEDYVDSESVGAKKGGREKRKKKGKENKNSRRDKLPLVPHKGDVSEKIVEEEEESAAEVAATGVEGKADGIAHKKEEREGKNRKLLGGRRTTNNEFLSLVPVSRLHESEEEQKPRVALERSASSSSVKKSFSPFRKTKKTSQSFRDELRDQSVSPDKNQQRKLSKESSASPPRSLGSRELTPESSGSDASGVGQGKKRKMSIAKRIKNIVAGGSKETSPKPATADSEVTLKTYTKLDEKNTVEDPGPVMLKTYKKLDADYLPSSVVESTSDLTASGSTSDVALSFSGSLEESGASMTSSGSLAAKKDSVPSRPQSAVALGSQSKIPGGGKGKRKESNDLEQPEVKSRLNLSPRSSMKPVSKSSDSGLLKKKANPKKNVNPKNASSPVAKRSASTSSPTTFSPKSFTRETSIPGKYSPTKSPRSSERGKSHLESSITSPRSSLKGSTSSTGKGIPSPRSSSSRGSTGDLGSPGVSPRSSMRGNLKGSSSTSPLSSRRASSQMKTVTPLASKSITSPTAKTKASSNASRELPGSTAAAKKGSSSSSSNSTGNKVTSTSCSLPSASAAKGPSTTNSLASSKSPSSPKTSPSLSRIRTSQQKPSPPSSPRSTDKSSQPSTMPFKASPLMLRKVVPSASAATKARSVSTCSVSGSVSSSRPDDSSAVTRKPAPPRLTKHSLGSPEVDTPASKMSPSFSRFSNVRKPVKFNKSPEVSNQPSPVMERSHFNVVKPSPLRGNSEKVDERALNKNSDVIFEVPTKPRTLSESSTVSTTSSHGTNLPQRKRRIGISCSDSPLLSPVVAGTFFGDNKTAQASPLTMDVDSLLASVERKLSDIASATDSERNNESKDALDVFDSSAAALPDSQQPSESGKSTQNASHSIASIQSPTISPQVIKKSIGDKKGLNIKSPTTNAKGKVTGTTKRLSSPATTSKTVPKISGEKNTPLKSPLPSSKAPESGKVSSPRLGKAGSSLPPKSPLVAKKSEPSSRVTSSKPPLSSMGTTRPRMVLVGGGTTPKGKTMSKIQSSPLLPSVTKENSTPDSVPPEAPKKALESRRNSTLNRSMKMRASSRNIRPGSANVAGRRASVAATQQQQQLGIVNQQQKEKKQDTEPRKSSLGTSTTARKSMRSVSSGDILKKARPGSSSTLGRDNRRSSLAPASGSNSTSMLSGGIYATMRKPKTSMAPSGLARSTAATSSMRLPRKMSLAGQKGTNTLRRGSKVGGVVPPASVADSSGRSTSRSSTLKRMSSGGTLRKQSSTGEMTAAFDHISSQAKVLVSSDHRRAVRPKTRQKASASHLKILSNRSDVSTDINNSELEEGKLDPNTYSTYMGKKNLAPSAVAGLTAKVDFSTVKLRKTSALQQMMADPALGSVFEGSSASPGVAAGVEYNTSHPVMLLQVKGRRNIQTRLAEPSGTALNSGDVFLVVTNDKLFHWVGKAANVIEKARGSDVVMRILHKKELGCKATAATVFKEEDRAVNLNSIKYEKFWELLGGKTGVKSSESVPGDEVYERAVNLATIVYKLEGADKESLQFVSIHENSNKMVSVDLLNTKEIFLFDFYSEVYVWIGNQSRAGFRRKAMELGKKLFDGGCKTPAFSLRNSPARSSGRYRQRGSMRSPRHSITNLSGRRSSKVMRADMKPRPEWALFARVTEGSESILFREKFGDWPEAGRIIKMKGHVSSGEVQVRSVVQLELHPADVDKMLKDSPPFEGLRLEGDNIYRGLGNFKVSKSTFSRNRVRTVEVKKWVVKEFDNVVIPSQNHGIFYTSEAYVVRWGCQITVVRELEGLGPGQGMFARDRAYQRSLQQAREGKPSPTKKEKRVPAPGDLSDTDSEADEEEDEEEKRLLESGGRDRCAYFFWQGMNCTVNEKGASALMTVELDKEKGPQIRVEQNREPPAFLNLFTGGMIILNGKSETDSLQNSSKVVRVFCVCGQMKSETCLVEVTPEDNQQPFSSCLRSRGCYIFYDSRASRVFVWYGAKSSRQLRHCATVSARMFRNRLPGVELVRANEGDEPNDLCSLLGNKENYLSLMKESKKYEYTPRLYELSSTIGEFVAVETVNPCRSESLNAFPFDQNHLYLASQPAMFLVDGWTEVYIWLGWWPVEKNKLLKEANATTGSSQSRWLRDKKLALETAQHYVKACNRTRTPRTFVVMAGTEHGKFKNLFPFWEDNKTVQELNCKRKPYPMRLDLEDELAKYSRTVFKLEDLKQKPPPEGVDPARLEAYLSDEDFVKLFKVKKEEFAKMALWKQTDKKKAVGLF